MPLTADITANVFDPHRYDVLIELLAEMVPYMASCSLYSSQELYESSRKQGIILVCPIKRCRHTKEERLKRYRFFRSKKGPEDNSQRSAIESCQIE